VDTTACGNCGTTTRSCTAEGAWGAWSACQGEGECSQGSTIGCASGTQSCGADCHYGACLECQANQTQTQGCGACQTQTRTCSTDGSWGAWTACSFTGACTPGNVQACSGGQETCTQDCQWGTCVPFECTPGTQSTQACALCGTQTSTCQKDGTWGAFGTCVGQGECEPNTTASCGAGQNQICDSTCHYGTCAAIECTDGAQDTQACGLCGSQSRTCVNGRWTQLSSCSNEGTCTPGSKTSCGTGGSQTCQSNCQWNDCTGQTCTGSFVQSCGVCGIQTRTCNNGVWSNYSACTGERDCIPGTTESCGDGGTRACNFQCYWDTCQ
jgi:hypothetical protein